jgi:cytochrome c biogenesis protein CcmG/thiol:disulfide interchange protein DsbE
MRRLAIFASISTIGDEGESIGFLAMGPTMVVMPSDRISKAALVLTLIVSACSSGNGPSAAPAHSPVPAANAATAPLLPTDALAFPDFDPAKFDQLLTQLEGTPVVVNFWGSWCTPCRQEAPLLAAAAAKYGDQVQFVGVDILDTKEAGRRYVTQFRLPYPSVFDPSPSGDVRNHLGYIGQPDTVFYDAQGAKVADWEGAISADELDKGIQKALGPAEPSPSGV